MFYSNRFITLSPSSPSYSSNKSNKPFTPSSCVACSRSLLNRFLFRFFTDSFLVAAGVFYISHLHPLVELFAYLTQLHYFLLLGVASAIMGHRHLFNASPMFEGEADPNWNNMLTDQHHVNHGGTSSSENGSFIYPVENMSIDNIYFPSHWNANTRSNGYASSGPNIEVPPPHQLDTSGTSTNDHFMHSSSAGPFFAVSENFVHQPSSSNYDRQAFHVDSGFIDLTMGSGRAHHKRKSPGIPSVYERGSSSGYFNAGSSSDLPIPPESWPEKPNMDPQYMPWDHAAMAPTFRGAGLSMKGESSVRNVRSRSSLDLESNLCRTHLSSSHSHSSYPTVPPVSHSSLADLSQVSTSLTRDWSQMNVTPANGRMLLPDASTFGLETSHFPVGNAAAAASNATVDVGSFHHEFGTSRNPTTAQSFQNLTQTARGTRSNYSQRSTPAYRASSSLRLGQATPSDNGLPMVAEGYSSRHPRLLNTVGWRNSDRNGRSRISSERYRSLADQAALHARLSSSEVPGFMIVERASLYGSRNVLDQHREMRMDIDNMSYEELLALGERIGQVNTGLSEDVLSKCVTETIYCSSDQCQDEGSCVICLEEYKNMDDVGTLKTCGHDYHVSCIKKWLSMKKLCPICKSSALPEDRKDK